MSVIQPDQLTLGFYHIYNQFEDEPVLVQYYHNSDARSWGFGFNIHDGSGFLPISDVSLDTIIKKVEIKEL